jgi:predicted DNA-binding transcriptional regulator YafY
MEQRKIQIVYKNYKNEVSTRNVIPSKIWYGSTEYHLAEQWFMRAWDLDKKAERDFALVDIQKTIRAG